MSRFNMMRIDLSMLFAVCSSREYIMFGVLPISIIEHKSTIPSLS